MKKITLLLGLYVYLFSSAHAQKIVPAVKTDSSNWLVRVTFKNNSQIKGVVLADRWIEKAGFAGSYQQIKSTNQKGSGIRVWYGSNNLGFVFISYKQVKSVIKMKSLSSEEIRQIKQRIEHSLQSGNKLPTLDKDEQEKVETEEPKQKAPLKPTHQEILESLPVKARELLKKYPPQKGWGLDRYKKLKPRRYKKKGGLTPVQRKFVDNYQQWKKALLLYQQKKNS